MTLWAKIMRDRQAAGLCRRCGVVRDGSSPALCIACRELELSQTRERRQKRILDGICLTAGCGKQLYAGGLCKGHYAKQIEYRKKYYLKKKEPK